MTEQRNKSRTLKDGLSIPDPSINRQYFPNDLTDLDRELYSAEDNIRERPCAGCRKYMAQWIMPLFQI
jgi:hypothetical protein